VRPGTEILADGIRFVVRSRDATALTLCIFDGEGEVRVPMTRADDDLHVVEMPGLLPGTRYGYRADGPWAPEQGLWFDPDKLLVDPYAVELDRRFAHDARLAAPRGAGFDTAPLVPRAIVPPPRDPVPPAPPIFRPGGLVYELNVRGFTMQHPEVPEAQRGTIAALRHPAIIAHLRKIGVSAVELMPIVAWIDERHLPPLGLSNAWGYNPVALMAIDPGLAPGGVAELRETVAALRAEGIGVILDLVFNHSGESDVFGPTLSMRGLDNRRYYAHLPDDPGALINDTGCGNTLACDRPEVRALILDSLRHFVAAAGVDGFRFDLAPVLARTPQGFDRAAPIFAEIAADPLLHDRVMIAEPWDIGPGGYQLGGFPPPWLEWNDRYRDDVRRFWRGDSHMLGALATRLAGSSDLYGAEGVSRSVNFLAAHDGFTLADLVSFAGKHNEANGEDNRDGHSENLSWNGGVEGATDDGAVLAGRSRDLRALLGTLFASRGTIMLTAGDEFGRSQRGNNNAYAQDNPIGWVDWSTRDVALEDYVAALAVFRAGHPMLADPRLLDTPPEEIIAVEWLRPDGAPMTVADWEAPDPAGVTLRLELRDGDPIEVSVDRQGRVVTLP